MSTYSKRSKQFPREALQTIRFGDRPTQVTSHLRVDFPNWIKKGRAEGQRNEIKQIRDRDACDSLVFYSHFAR